MVHRSMMGSYFMKGAIDSRWEHSEAAFGVPTAASVADAWRFSEESVT